MNELIKITDMTGSHGVSARTLRYYEDIGFCHENDANRPPGACQPESSGLGWTSTRTPRRLSVARADCKGRVSFAKPYVDTLPE